MAGISKVAIQLAHEAVLDQLRDQILDGDLAPGEPIDEIRLCELFGISRTPVREALKVLAWEGLVELLPRRGAVVSQLTTDRLVDQFEAIAVIEKYAVEKLCRSRNEQAVRRLSEVDVELTTSIRSGPRTNYSRTNLEFHRNLVASAENETLSQVHERITAQLRRARYISALRLDRRAAFRREHAALMEAIRRFDAEASVKLLQEHLDHVRDTSLEALN